MQMALLAKITNIRPDVKRLLYLMMALCCALFLTQCDTHVPVKKTPPPSLFPESRVVSPSTPVQPSLETQIDEIRGLYRVLRLSGKLRYDIFRKAMIGHGRIGFKRTDIITIVDYTRPSAEKRLFVIDLKTPRILYHTHVTHGLNSGFIHARNFSNELGSKQSSLGFFKTAETYFGKYGYSLRLDGLEKGINDLARKRDIVVHGAPYANPANIAKYGYLGTSWGCPALPEETTGPIIDAIKEGSCLYIYADDQTYLSHSAFVDRRRESAGECQF
jgi:hypothetical protein